MYTYIYIYIYICDPEARRLPGADPDLVDDLAGSGGVAEWYCCRYCLHDCFQ